MTLFLLNLNPLKNRLHMLMFSGLLFSWAGDVILEFSDNSNMFTLGLISFLLAHVMYFMVFVSTPGRNTILSDRKWVLIPVISYGAVLVSILYNDLAQMRLPVIMYTIVILTMLSGAINRIGKVKKASFNMILAGAILFVISDSVIAVNKFSYPFASSGIVIMSTYVLAQYLLVTGYFYQFRSGIPDQISR